MALTLDTTLLTNVCYWVGRAHNSFVAAVGRESDTETPFWWVEMIKSFVRGGNDLQTGIASGSALAVAAQGTPNNTVNITGGNVVINGQTVAVATNATYGSSTIFTQTCTDLSPLTSGQFYDAALCADHLGALTVFRGDREDRTDSEAQPEVPHGYCVLAAIRVKYGASGTVITNADITMGQTLTSFAAQTNDAAARLFNDFDTGQTRMISRSAVKAELGFGLTALDKYVKTVTASQGLNGGAGYTLLQWAKTTHQTTTPWDFPAGFAEYVRVIKSNKDPSQRLATVTWTGSGTATVTDLKKVIGTQDQLEVVVVTAGGTGAAQSTLSMTVQSTGSTLSSVYSVTIPPFSPNGTILPMTVTGTAPLQLPVPGTAVLTVQNASTVYAAQPAGTIDVRIYTSIVTTSPITVTGGSNLDKVAIRNAGTL